MPRSPLLLRCSTVMPGAPGRAAAATGAGAGAGAFRAEQEEGSLSRLPLPLLLSLALPPLLLLLLSVTRQALLLQGLKVGLGPRCMNMHSGSSSCADASRAPGVHGRPGEHGRPGDSALLPLPLRLAGAAASAERERTMEGGNSSASSDAYPARMQAESRARSGR